MHTTDLPTQSAYRAYLAYFLYQMGQHVDSRISHQLLNNAEGLKDQATLTDLQASALIDQAHATAKAEFTK